LLMLIGFLFYFYGGFELLKWNNIVQMRGELIDTVKRFPLYAVLIFIAVYIVYTFISIPGLIVLDLLGGFLFPQPFSTLMVLFSGTFGATMIFLATKHALGDWLIFKKDGMLYKIKTGFERHQKSYLLFMRLVPIFPLGIVNIALGLLNVRTWVFIWTTAVGLIPASFIYTQVGSGLGKILDEGGAISIYSFLNSQIIMALIGIGLLALMPIFFKKKEKQL